MKLFLILLFAALSPLSASAFEFSRVGTITGEAVDLAVKSNVYPEAPNLMYVTMRGGGLAIFDLSDPSKPQILGHYMTNTDVEGQDRMGNTMVVIARLGYLYTLDVSGTVPKVKGKIDILRSRNITDNTVFGPNIMALHTKIASIRGRLYAFVANTKGMDLAAVDITDVNHPFVVSHFYTGLMGLESVFIRGERAYVGGFSSNTLMVVNISDPSHMRVTQRLTDSAYSEMVSEGREDCSRARSGACRYYLYSALWGSPGGLAIFDITDPDHAFEVSRVLSSKAPKANRVKLEGDYAFLPLESKPSPIFGSLLRGAPLDGIAVVNVRNPRAPYLVSTLRHITGAEIPYTLLAYGEYVYVFSSLEKSMVVLKWAP